MRVRDKQKISQSQQIYDCNSQTNYFIRCGHGPAQKRGGRQVVIWKWIWIQCSKWQVLSEIVLSAEGQVCATSCAYVRAKHLTFFSTCDRENMRLIKSQWFFFFFFRIFHCRYFHLYLYSLLFHQCHCLNIYSNWLMEQFSNLFLNMLYILSLQ